MIKGKSRRVPLCLLTLCAFVNVISMDVRCQGDGLDSIRHNKISIEIDNQDIIIALKTIAGKARVPIGIELPPDTYFKVSVTAKEENVETVLSKIPQLRSSFYWEIVDGVINIKAIGGQKSLLDAGVSQFTCDNASLQDLEVKIYSMPEFKNAIKQMGLSTEAPFYLNIPVSGITRISLDLQDATIRGILNSISRYSYFWCVYIAENNIYIVL